MHPEVDWQGAKSKIAGALKYLGLAQDCLEEHCLGGRDLDVHNQIEEEKISKEIFEAFGWPLIRHQNLFPLNGAVKKLKMLNNPHTLSGNEFCDFIAQKSCEFFSP